MDRDTAKWRVIEALAHGLVWPDPHLLCRLSIEPPNQVWSMDHLHYDGARRLRLPSRGARLVRVLSLRRSITVEAAFYVETLLRCVGSQR